MKKLDRIKIGWLIPLLMALALFRPFSSLAFEDPDPFSWLHLIPPGYWLDSWSFVDEGTNFNSDFGFPPLNYTNVIQVPDWDGNALQVDSTNTARLIYAITENAPGYGEYTNLSLGVGSIEFLFSPNWQSDDTNYYGSGPGDYGRFIEAGAWGTNADSDWWSLYLNPYGTGIYFSSGTNGIRTNYLSAPISWGGGVWEMVVLTYSASNSFIYLDGQLVASGDGVRYVPSGNTLTNGFSIGSDFATGLQQAHGQFDDLYTYNYQLSADDIANDYAEISPELPGSFHFGGGFGPDDEPPGPGGGGGGGGSGGGEFYGPPAPDYGTNLFLVITNAFNNLASGWITNSSIYVPYTIFSRQNLLWPIWTPEATFYGSWSTNFTAFSVPMLARSDLFLEARSEIAPRIIGGGNAQFATLRRDGTVWTWGDGEDGQLGNGQWTNSDAPVQVIGLSNVVAIAVPSTGDYDLALDALGNVWSWGANDNGQLGLDDGLYDNENTPAIVPGLSNIVAIAGGSGHAIALRSDGTVWAWGDNAYGDLGDNSDEGRDDAEPVSGLTNAIAIASGDSHCFAIGSDGRVWGWGFNEVDQLGIGNEDDQPLPYLVSGLTNAVALSGGEWHSIALLANGTIEAWGDNLEGEIGDISSSTPVPVPGFSNIVSIACGGYHNLFIDTNGDLFAWGVDFDGQFGDDGANDGSTVPYLSTISNVTAIAGGAESSVVSTGNGNVYTFGDSYEYEPSPTLTDLYTNYSSDGSGLPDWWELMYFHHLGLNPSSDPVGDGWTLLQDFEQNLDPTNFIEPPAVTGLAVAQTNVLGNIILTWNAEVPTPLDYAIYRIDYNYTNWQYGTAQEIGEVASNVTTFTDTGSVPGDDDNSIYEVDGIYGGGISPFSAQGYVNSELPGTLSDNLPFTAELIRNGTGRWQIMFSGLPTGLQTVQLSWQSDSGIATQDIAVSNIVNGVYAISDSDVVNDLGTTLYAEGIGPDNLPGQQIYVGALPNDAPYFVDGRQHMDQNLDFLIRGANIAMPFAGSFDDFSDSDEMNQTNISFEEFSFLHHDWDSFGEVGYSLGPYLVLDNLWPFEANYYLADFLVNTNLYRPASPPGDQVFLGTNNFSFQPNFATNIPAPPILDEAGPYWILQEGFYTASDTNNAVYWGVDTEWGSYNPPIVTVEEGINNLFGLPYQTGCLMGYQGTNVFYQILPVGEPTTAETNTEEPISYPYGSWCLAPTLQFTNYYLAPLNNANMDTMNLPSASQQPYPLPIDDSFAVTNQTPAVMFGSVGQPMIIGAWAKYVIQGSSPTKYAYLGQYFTTNAWELDGSGNPTTTNAGVVSPYGEFFPTEPGPVALITMTNTDSGTQATGIVDVISLALDANHDGTIDPTWNGPDFTSPSAPYVFWANNNYDRWDYDFLSGTNEQDDVLPGDDSAPEENQDPDDPDCNYTVDGQREIPDTRDLEDFARLWVCGLTSNLLAELPAGSTVTLNWGDVGTPNANNPTIDIFNSSDVYGDIAYQTNEDAANNELGSGMYVGRVSPGQSIQLEPYMLDSEHTGGHFIWCGVTNGMGGLTLTVYDPNSNILAQTTAYIKIEDIKQMYERWTVGEDGSTPLLEAQLATNDLPPGVSQPFQYVNPPAPNTPYILCVHGWNMAAWDKDRYAETAFKRLYWQGYQGRFGDFHWPTYSAYIVDGEPTYDESEQLAWQSAEGLCYKLVDLNAQYPGNVYLMAHSMGNIVAGEALRQATQSGIGQIVNTYIAMQAAVPSHAYDTNATDRSIPTLDDWGTPDVFANYYTNGAPCYFNAIAGAGTFVNFFNTNDFALNVWTTDQNSKQVVDGAAGYTYDHTTGNYFENYDTTELFLPGDTYTIFPRIIQARCYAVGAQLNIGGAFSTNNQVNLPSVWPPDPSGDNYDEHLWHSAEFRSDYSQRWLFWNTALARMRLNSNP